MHKFLQFPSNFRVVDMLDREEPAASRLGALKSFFASLIDLPYDDDSLLTDKWTIELGERMAVKGLVPSGMQVPDLLKIIDRGIYATKMMREHKPSCHDAPTLLVKVTKDKTPSELYARWDILSNMMQQTYEIPMAHGVMCANENAAQVADALMGFCENREV